MLFGFFSLKDFLNSSLTIQTSKTYLSPNINKAKNKKEEACNK